LQVIISHRVEAQSVGIMHVAPLSLLHMPLELHVHGLAAQLPFIESQAPVSVVLFTAASLHVPFTMAPLAWAHVEQGPVHALSQQ
jgi:hypothetical protein